MTVITSQPLTDSAYAPPSDSVAGSSASSAAIFKRLHPSQYLSRFLAQEYRPDGRKTRAWRDVNINVVPNIDLPALCSPRYKPGPPSDEAQTLSNWLSDLLVSSRTLPPQRLCISPGKAVWTIYIDVVCINYDGNAFDAAVLAVMSALKNRDSENAHSPVLAMIARLPRATFDDETGRTTCSRDETFPLPLDRFPLSASFGIFHSSHLLPDPTSFETPLLPTKLTIALDENGRGCLLRHEGLGGIVGMSGDKVMTIAWEMAEERIREMRTLMPGS
ncbi:MAG: hypothetical protein TREMPRED_002516 [Tremellales sp. Tagirdzhanova-0007]|nr:MAG: hypothetical protein TREMPRED_002516 [Tremellales sp. Tagirdzhanova-0007]